MRRVLAEKNRDNSLSQILFQAEDSLGVPKKVTGE